MVKEFTAAEKALLDSKPIELDVIQKKERERLKARIYMENHRNKLKETKGIGQYKIDKNVDMKIYRTKQKTTYLKAVAEKTNDPVEIKTINNTIQKIEKKQKESIESLRQKSQREAKPVDRLKIIQDAPKVNTKKQQEDADKNPQWFIRLVKSHPNFKINDPNYVAERAYETKSINRMIGIISTIMNDVENKKLFEDLKANYICFKRFRNRRR